MKLGYESLEDLSAGAVFLATGGGGDPYTSYLATLQVLRQTGPVELIPVDDLDDDAWGGGHRRRRRAVREPRIAPVRRRSGQSAASV